MSEIGSNHCSQGYSSNNANVPIAPKKKTPRKNPWGNSSYADLITQAIEASPEKKLTLSQIYDWMIRNIPHFSNQVTSNSSAGWKNSIRHNLSLHERFLRIKNDESSGKSSWWTINKAAGTGRTTRRKNGGKKKLKGLSSPQKSLFRKVTAQNLKNQCFSSSTFKENLQNLSSFPNPDKRRWFSCSSTSSEDTESLQSFSSTSPPSHESEILRQNFYNAQSTLSSIDDYQSIHIFNGKYVSSSNNVCLSSDADFYGHNRTSLKGYEASLNSKYLTNFNDHQNSQCVNTFKNFSVEEDVFSNVSAEYFKIPHHLSGSYMTSETSRIENTFNPKSTAEKQVSSFVINGLGVHETQKSLIEADTLEFNKNIVFKSNQLHNSLKQPFISQHPREINNNVFVDDFMQKQIKIEPGLFNENKNLEEIKTNKDEIQNHLDYYYVVPYEMESEVQGYETVNVCSMEDVRLNQNNEYSDGARENVCSVENIINTTTYIPNQDPIQETFIFDTGKSKKCYKNVTEKLKNHIKLESNEQSCLQNDKISIPGNPTFSYNSNECHNTNNNAVKLEVSLEEKYDRSLEDYPMDQEKMSSDRCLANTNQECKKIVEKDRTLKNDNDKSYLNVKTTLLTKRPKSSDCENNQENCSFITDVTFTFEEDYKFDTTGAKKFGKLDVLVYNMVKLVLLKVENMELSKNSVNAAFKCLHSLSLKMNQKKFLVILTELLFALKASYKYCILNGSIKYSNYNSYYKALLLSHFGYEADLNSAFCLYANVLDVFISDDFIGKVLSDSRIKCMDNPPNLILYLQLYLTDVLKTNHVTEDITNKNSEKEIRENGEKFVPASVYLSDDICDFCNEINIMSNINYSYVHQIEYFIKRRFLDNDLKSHFSPVQPNLNVLQKFLSAIKLKPKKQLGVNFTSAPTDKNQINVIKLNTFHENENLNFNIQAIESKDTNNGNSDMLPKDLVDVEVSRNLDFSLDYKNIDFEFSNYDLSYDVYL